MAGAEPLKTVSPFLSVISTWAPLGLVLTVKGQLLRLTIEAQLTTETAIKQTNKDFTIVS